MAERKIYIGSEGPYLFDDAELIEDPDGDFSGEYQLAARADSPVKAPEFIGVPVMGVSVANIDDPSSELNPLSASGIGGLLAAYKISASADDEFTLYLWDTDAAAENVPYSVDGNGGTWIAVGGKYRNGDVYVEGSINAGGSLESHATAHENGGGDEISVTGLSGLLADDQHVLDSEVESVITAELVDGESIDNAIDSLISTHNSDEDAHSDTIYTPNSVTLNTGSSSDAVSDIQTLLDGNVYDILEAASTPGFDLEIDFTSVLVEPNCLVLRLSYGGLATHGVGVDIYNYNDTAFDRFHSFAATLDYIWIHIDIPDMDTDYIDGSNNAQVRLYHFTAGNNSHHLYVDYVALIRR